MKSLSQHLTESLNEAIPNISPKQSSSDLIVQINLSRIDKETLQSIFHDWSIDWSKLNKKDLEKLYNLVGSDLSFDEWVEANDFA